MKVIEVDILKSCLMRLKQEAVSWGKTEGWNWIYVLKTMLAMFLAMGISMRFNLDQPSTAMVSVLIVMQPQTGMVLTKSLYRIAGTLAGLLASLVLVGLFAQEPEMFIIGLALWVGFCTAGAAFYRNFKSYGFVLSGYTAALVGLPAAMQPQAFFPIAVTRLSEVTLGILCAGVISDTILPRRLSDVIISNVQNRYTEFIAFVRASLAGTVGKQELESMHLRLVGNVISLESIRSAATLEDPEVRARDRRLKKLNSEFMAASTTFHSFRQLMQRLTKSSAPAGQALDMLYESLGDTLVNIGEAPRTAGEAHRAARQIAAFRAVLSRRVEEVRTTLSNSPDPLALMDFETAVELLFRFVRELHAYSRTYATLPDEEQGANPPDDISFASSTDPLVALLTGGRAFAAILLVGTFWIFSGWTNGVNALMFAAIVSALCASAPDPSSAVRQMTFGFTVGFLAVSLFKFVVIPSLDGFMLLCAGLAPVLMAGLYFSTNPRWGEVGTGFLVFFTSMVAPANSMQFNPVAFINDGIAMIMGVAAAGVMFVTFMPATGEWLMRRLERQLRRQVVMACFDPFEGLIHRFESSTHELLHKLASKRKSQDTQDQQLMAWMFPAIEIGRAIVHVRKDADSIQVSQSLSDFLQESIRSISRLFKQPSSHRRDTAIENIARVIEAVCLEVELESYDKLTRDVLRRMLTSLHLIRSSLLDDDTVLSTAVNNPTAVLLGGVPHVA
jgi:uncharacterized membrane protein YccC